MSDRGRLTPIDVVWAVVSLAALAALSPAFYSFLSKNAYIASTPVVFLLQMLVPLLGLTLIAIIYTNAIQGVQRR